MKKTQKDDRRRKCFLIMLGGTPLEAFAIEDNAKIRIHQLAETYGHSLKAFTIHELVILDT